MHEDMAPLDTGLRERLAALSGKGIEVQSIICR